MLAASPGVVRHKEVVMCTRLVINILEGSSIVATCRAKSEGHTNIDSGLTAFVLHMDYTLRDINEEPVY